MNRHPYNASNSILGSPVETESRDTQTDQALNLLEEGTVQLQQRLEFLEGRLLRSVLLPPTSEPASDVAAKQLIADVPVAGRIRENAERVLRLAGWVQSIISRLEA